MRCQVTGMVRRGEDRLDVRIALERPDGPIWYFASQQAIPAS
jgi:hypothetical protein